MNNNAEPSQSAIVFSVTSNSFHREICWTAEDGELVFKDGEWLILYDTDKCHWGL